nr:gamma-glutamylcyclotransferase family protein [Bacillus rubiinfantis]
MNSKLYLAYGSNLNLEQMANRCPTAKVVGASQINDHRLLFRGAHAGAVATIEPFKGNNVPVLVWEITPADEAALDRYEGWPFLYRKETVKVKLDGKTVKAMVYIMNDGRPLGQPSCYYYSTILEGYKSACFDVEILRKATTDSVESEEVANE